MGNEEQNYDNGGWQTTSDTGEFHSNSGQSQDNNYGYSNNEPYNNYVPEPEDGPGFSIAGMVCGILSIVLCCCNQYVSGILSIVGLVLSIMALKQHRPGRGMAIAGVVCSAIGLIIALILVIFSVYMLMNPDYMNGILSIYEQYGLMNR